MAEAMVEKNHTLQLFDNKASELLDLFENLPVELRLDALDVLQGVVNMVVQKITGGRLSSVRFIPVEAGNNNTHVSDNTCQHVSSYTSRTEPDNAPQIQIKQEPVDDFSDTEPLANYARTHKSTKTSDTPAAAKLSRDAIEPRGRRLQVVISRLNLSMLSKQATVKVNDQRVASSKIDRRNSSTSEHAVKKKKPIKRASSSSSSSSSSSREDVPLASSGWRIKAMKLGYKIPTRRRKKDHKVGRLQCTECDYSTNLKTHMTAHMVTHTGISRFECKPCQQVFTAASSLRRHQRAHQGIRNYMCPVCGKRFVDMGSLRTHSVVHTGEKLFKCDECPKTYTNSANLSRHRRVHTGEMPYACQTCDMRFRDMSSLSLHTLKHTGEKPYSCEVCDKRFKTSSDMRRHERIHTGEKPYECKQCGQHFLQNWHLRQHEHMHAKLSAWPCEECGKRFRSKAAALHHARWHAGVRPYVCPTCGKRFSTRHYMQNHQVVHTNARPHVCRTCGARFGHVSNMRRHMRMHSDKLRYKCRYCTKGFKYINSWRYHEGTHKRHACVKCGCVVGTQCALATHVCGNARMKRKTGKAKVSQTTAVLNKRKLSADGMNETDEEGLRLVVTADVHHSPEVDTNTGQSDGVMVTVDSTDQGMCIDTSSFMEAGDSVMTPAKRHPMCNELSLTSPQDTPVDMSSKIHTPGVATAVDMYVMEKASSEDGSL